MKAHYLSFLFVAVVPDVSMTDNAYALLSMPLASYSANGAPVSRGRDLLNGGTPCYGMYRTLDGYISVGALEPKFWAALCQALQRPDLQALQFPDNLQEVARVKAMLQEVLEQKSSTHWAAFFKDKDCCVEVGE